MAVVLQDSGTPSNLESGDILKINQNIPKTSEYVDGYTSITYVGNLGLNEYGFITNKSFTQGTLEL